MLAEQGTMRIKLPADTGISCDPWFWVEHGADSPPLFRPPKRHDHPQVDCCLSGTPSALDLALDFAWQCDKILACHGKQLGKLHRMHDYAT